MGRYSLTNKKFIVLLLVFGLSQAVWGQEQTKDEPLYTQLTETFKKEYFSIGVLLQTVGDYQPQRSFGGNNGFSIANLRLKLSGELDHGFGYLLQTNFTGSPSILDAVMYFRVTPSVTIDAGLFKSPFSKELLTGAGAIDFVNRAQVVTSLAPARQIGVKVSGWLQPDVFSFAVGAFNGNGFAGNNNDNDHLLYAARLTLTPALTDANNAFEIGINAAFSEDDGVSLPGVATGFAGSRFLLGGDARLTRGRLLLSGEAIYANLEADAGASANPYGFHVTAGYMVSSKSQLLLRWDGFEKDGLADDSYLLIFGFNLWPTKATELQVNYIFPTEQDFENQQVLINAQFAF